MDESKNNIAWSKLFKKYQISENVDALGFYKIDASTINEFREARLMTKFDFKSQLPEIFSNNNLSILPVSRGTYIISDFYTFKDFELNEVEITKIDFPNYLESIDFNNITSESTALNCAYVSGIIEDFVQDEGLKPTVSGRMGSSVFDFKIDSEKMGCLSVNVSNSQIEIDGGYEGIESLKSNLLLELVLSRYEIETKEINSNTLQRLNNILKKCETAENLDIEWHAHKYIAEFKQQKGDSKGAYTSLVKSGILKDSLKNPLKREIF